MYSQRLASSRWERCLHPPRSGRCFAIGENPSDGQSGQGQSLDAVRLGAGGRHYWRAENPRLRRRDGGQYRMEAHPNDVLLAKPAKIAETEKQLDRTNSRPDMPGRPISSASQTPYPLAQAVLHRSSLPTQDSSATTLKLTERSPRFGLHLRPW